MKRNIIKFLITYCIVSSVGCFAEEKNQTTSPKTDIVPPPPPPIQSSYFTEAHKAESSDTSGPVSSAMPVGSSEIKSTDSSKTDHASTTTVKDTTSSDKNSVKNTDYSDDHDNHSPLAHANNTTHSSLPVDHSKETPITTAKDDEKNNDDKKTESSDISKDSSKKITPPTNTSLAATTSSADFLGNASKNNSTSDNSSEPIVNDKDASTGIQGAHITSGIGFEGEEQDDTFSIGGVDTSHVKYVSGNWVEKKKYWHEIEEIVDQVKEKIADIMNHRTTFFGIRSEADKELSTFYQHVGLDQGPLQDMIHYTLEIMEKEKEHQGFLNKKERIFYEKVQAKQRIFEQLKEDVKAIAVVDSKIDEALEVVLKQVNSCNEYEGEVWNIYKTVAYELSEKEAEHYYLVAQAFLKDIENIQMYLSGPFANYFNELTDSLQTHTHNIVMQLDTLEKEGINLKKEVTIFETEECNSIKVDAVKNTEVSKDGKIASVKDEEKHQKVVKKESFSLVSSLKNFLSSIGTFFNNSFQTFKGLLSWGKKEQKLVAKKPTVVSEKSDEHSSNSPIHTNHEEPMPGAVEVHSLPSSQENTMNVKKDDMHPVVADEEHYFGNTLQYDKEQFGHEMEELKQSLQAGINDVENAPVDIEKEIKKEL